MPNKNVSFKERLFFFHYFSQSCERAVRVRKGSLLGLFFLPWGLSVNQNSGGFSVLSVSATQSWGDRKERCLQTAVSASWKWLQQWLRFPAGVWKEEGQKTPLTSATNSSTSELPFSLHNKSAILCSFSLKRATPGEDDVLTVQKILQSQSDNVKFLAAFYFILHFLSSNASLPVTVTLW